MSNVRKLLIPAVLFSSTMIILLTRALYNPSLNVQANSDVTTTPQEFTSVESENLIATDKECSIPSSYPDAILQWCDSIDQYARYYGLDPKLVAAVMLQESGGNPEAYSKSGAVGLMQVMPRDGLAEDFMCVNGPCFSSRPSIEELSDPHFNIDYGTMLLSGLVSRYGDIREGLRAYGPYNSGYHYADTVLAIYERYQ